jgi:serine/threonine-protein kinase HipA
MSWSYNPAGGWTAAHQMSMNGKRDGFVLDDFKACAKSASLKRGRGEEILAQVLGAVRNWKKFAAAAGVPARTAGQIASTHRLKIR